MGDDPPSTKKKKSAPKPVAQVQIEDLGPDEIRIETPVVAEQENDSAKVEPKKKKKQVGFQGIDDDEQGRVRLRDSLTLDKLDSCGVMNTEWYGLRKF